MALEEKQLILSLDFSTDEALQRAAEFRQATDLNKAALQELNKVIKESGEITKEQALQREKLEQSIRESTKARGDELRAVDAYIKATKATLDANGKYTGSIKELRASLSFLTEQWNGLNREERENAQVGGVLQKEVKRLSDELKELEGSVGDNRRSVGGYLDAIKQAPGFMGKFRAGVDGISAAMGANPFGLILQLLPQIMALFNSSGEGADYLAKVMGQINAVIQVGLKYLVQFSGIAVDAGKKAGEALSNPKQVLLDLVEFMKTNLTNRFKAFGVILDGIKNMDLKKLTDGTVQLGTGITDITSKVQNFGKTASDGFAKFSKDVQAAADAGGRLAESMDALEEKERSFGLASAKTEKEINKLLTQARNRQTSEAERIKLLERAEKLELERNRQEIALAQKRIDLMKVQNDLNQEDADAQDERLKDAQIKKIQLEQQTESILEKIQNRKDQLADAAAEKEKKRQEEAAAAELKRLEDIETQRQIALTETARFLDELAALDKKAADESAEMDAFLLSVDIANARKAAKEDEAASKEKIANKKKEQEALSELQSAGAALFAALAEENSDFAVFQKALTLFNISLASAEAISKGIAASQGVGFPLNLIAMGTTIATVSANLLEAKNLIKGEPPKPQHYDGFGYTGDGNPTSESTAVGPKPYTYHKKELIASNAALSTPLGAAAGNVLMDIMGKQKRFDIPGYYNGGLSTAAMQPLTSRYLNQSQPIIDYGELAKAMAAQPVYTIPTEIVSKANQTNARKTRTQIG